jgi:hypothetical protein
VNQYQYKEDDSLDFKLKANILGCPTGADKLIQIRQKELPPAQFIQECIDPNIVITSFRPAKTQTCPAGSGIADTF